MKSESDIQELFAKIKSHIEKLPKKRGRTTSVSLIGSKMVIKTRGKYDEEIEPPDEIEFDEGLIDREGLVALGRRVRYLAIETPKPNFYADAWLKMTLNDTETPSDRMPSNEDVAAFKSSLPPSLLMRKESENLIIRLFQAKNIFEPLIFIESGLKKVKDGTGYRSCNYISEKDMLVKMFEKDLLSYKRSLEKLNIYGHLIKYIQTLPFSSEPKCINNGSMRQGKKYTGISRVNYAFMMMVLNDLPTEIKRIALFDCKNYLKYHKKEKLTKVSIHTLCRIIYTLLDENATDKTPKGKAYCFDLTAKILTAFSPIDEDGNPYYSIDARGVEFALTRI